MKEVFKHAQVGLKKFFGYKGKIDGLIGRKSETALNKIHWINSTGWDRERKAIAYAQFRLNAEGAKLKIDGLWGSKSKKAWIKHGPGSGNTAPGPETPTSSGWMPGVQHVPRWNHSSRPTFAAKGIVLHRTAGHFDTGDYAVGKWGNYRGRSHKGSSLGYHFLIGKNDGEVIQFCSIKRHVAHVRKWSRSYVGIEFSGDIGQYRDGYKHGEDLTTWQINTGVKVIKWITKQLNIPRVEVTHQSSMFKLNTVFNGLVGHRDLSGNTHADSPNKGDWKKIMDAL